jgi:hypothetical protein
MVLPQLALLLAFSSASGCLGGGDPINVRALQVGGDPIM